MAYVVYFTSWCEIWGIHEDRYSSCGVLCFNASTLKKEAAWSYETLVRCHITAERNNPEDHELYFNFYAA